MGNLKFGEQSTKDLGLVIQAPPVYEFPAKEVTVAHIPGRNGDLVIDTDSFKNVARTYSIASVFKPGTDFVANSEKIIKWLTSKEGYQRLEDSYDPEVYRLAVFKNNGALQNYYDEATALNITFECKPQRYLKVGEKEVSVESSEMTIKNPTAMTSLPKIKIEGISTGTDNNKKVIMCSVKDKDNKVTSNVTLSDLDSTTVILDSEKQTAEDANGKNVAKSVGLNGSTFPKFKEGINKIKIEKYSEVPLSIEAYQNLIDNTKKALIARYKSYEDLVESKQNKATIKSWKKLVEDNQEQYSQEAYQNAVLDAADHYAYESFDKSLSENATYLEFNTDNIQKIILYKENGQYGFDIFLHPDDYEPYQATLAVFARGDFNKDTDYTGIYDTEQEYIWYYLIQNSFTQCIDDNTKYGCFMCIEDLDDTSKNSKTLTFVRAYTLGELVSSTDLIEKMKAGKADSRSISNKFDSPCIMTRGHNFKITLYRAKWNNGNPEIVYNNENEPEWFKTRIKYDKDTTESNPTRSVTQVEYYVTRAGYSYKPKSSSSGVLSNVLGSLTSLIPIFNTTGWSKVDANSIVESIAWNAKKMAFVQSGFLSSSEEYSIERYFIDEDPLPQYVDIVLPDTYEEDANGNVKTDAAGNKINKTIKNRIYIMSVSDDFKTITKIKIKDTGYYKFNEEYTSGSIKVQSKWYYYTADTEITLTSSIANNHGYDSKTTKSNNVYYMASVPNYSTEKEYPAEWLDIEPKLYSVSNPDTPLSDEGLASGAESNILNAAQYDLVVSKKEWIWYNFIESDISKITNHVIKDIGNVIGKISPDNGTAHRESDKDFTLYQMDIDSDNPEVFPIHDYEFVETTDNSSNIYLPNVKGKILFDFNINKVYHKGEYCLYPVDGNAQHIYKCIVDNSTEGAFVQSQWEIQNDLVQLIATEYDKTVTYNENDYCIYDRSLWICIASSVTGDFDETKWSKCGEYIKNIGFFDLTQEGREEEYALNIPPSDWIKVHIVRGSSDDYSDTVLEYKVLNASSSNTYYYSWNEHTNWIQWSKKEDPTEDVIMSELYKTDATIFMMEELPEYDLNNYYDFEVIESSEGNPESVNIIAKQDAYYKVGSSSNYNAYKIGDILDNIKIDQKLDMIYLEPDNDPVSGISILVIPRWWAL